MNTDTLSALLPTTLPVTLIVNAGGQSRRMGQPKALLPLPPTNRPLLETIVQRFQTLAPQQT
ncbi:MAG: NTP transferase domain-containing protein, partial [Caldilineaceae bacterium]|nr:NTP transferase domain-containing protein [Caldilineaceae bacterium]